MLKLSSVASFRFAKKTVYINRISLNFNRSKFSSHILKMSMLRSLDEFGNGENSFQKYLVRDNVPMEDGSTIFPRQVKKIHFTNVLPESVPRPYFIAASKTCAEMLELDPSEFGSDKFSSVFSGNVLVPGLDKPYATVYGCHCFGQWFGQLGDGRALSIGEVCTHKATTASSNKLESKETEEAPRSTAATMPHTHDYYGDHVQELQLKGCGRSPYSRGFDGRAVLRSSVREYLGEMKLLRRR